MARFFIDRPVFAWVIAILIMMAGGISIFRLPVEQYPRIAPPVVTITAKYSGASAQTLEDTVAQVIEQKLNGIDGLLYINSTSDAAGQVSIRLTFDPDTNPDVAQMQVQNKLQLATSSLPEEVTPAGHHRNQGGGQLPSDVRSRVVRRFHERGGPVRFCGLHHP